MHWPFKPFNPNSFYVAPLHADRTPKNGDSILFDIPILLLRVHFFYELQKCLAIFSKKLCATSNLFFYKDLLLTDFFSSKYDKENNAVCNKANRCYYSVNCGQSSVHRFYDVSFQRWVIIRRVSLARSTVGIVIRFTLFISFDWARDFIGYASKLTLSRDTKK